MKRRCLSVFLAVVLALATVTYTATAVDEHIDTSVDVFALCEEIGIHSLEDYDDDFESNPEAYAPDNETNNYLFPLQWRGCYQ